jgi:hypothetical protein
MALAVPFRHSRSSISRATSLLPTRGFSREPSQPNIYAPPTLGVPFIRARSEVKEDPKSEPKPTKVTPGRRGEKRKKDFDVERAEAESRRKKAGRVTASSLSGSGTNGLDVILNGSSDDPFAADFAASSLVDVQQSLVQKSNEFETKNKAVCISAHFKLFRNLFAASSTVYQETTARDDGIARCTPVR